MHRSAQPMKRVSIPETAAISLPFCQIDAWVVVADMSYSTLSTPSCDSIIGMIRTSWLTTSAIAAYESCVVYCVIADTIVTDR